MQKILPVILSLGLASLSINAKATELTNLTELNLNTQLSLESKASAQGTDVTLVCFITDTSKCTGYEFGMNSKERCCAEGYCQDACEFPKVPTCKSENWTMRYPLKAAGSLADSIVTSFMSNCRGVTIAFHHKRMKHATLTAKPAI